MECEKCQELLSEFLDGALEGEHHAHVDAHLAECLNCHGVRSELESIVNVCRECQGDYDAVPNERALWLRISNIIESEQIAAKREAPRGVISSNAQPGSWWTRAMNRSWQLSFPQLATAVAAIAIAVSLATAFGVRRVQTISPGAPLVASSENSGAYPAANNSSGDSRDSMIVPASMGDMQPQQMTIEYWKDRVEKRMNRWNPQTRDAFVRNMQVIDETVQDASAELRRNPHDEVSEEMLNAALNDKVELLREFSDL